MIKAIETRYKGYRFRSRLEARWAVFFYELGIAYEYEKQGFDLDGLAYLPDFWLPDLRTWFEVKGQLRTDEYLDRKALLLCLRTHCNVYVFYGECCGMHDPFWADKSFSVGYGYREGLASDTRWPSVKTVYQVAVDAFFPCCWVKCFWCDRPFIAPAKTNTNADHPYADPACPYCYETQAPWDDSLEWKIKDNAIIRAYDVARSARFEHGETS